MKRPYFSLLSAIVVAAMTLTACGNSTNSDKDNNSGSQDPASAEKVGSSWDDFEKCCARLAGEEYKVLAIEWKGEADNGGFIFSSKELFGKEKFKKGESIAVKMAMEGSIPNNGISYISPDGTSMEMSLSQSGMDGSLVLVPGFDLE